MDEEFDLGEKVQDKVTGLSGTVTAKCIYLTGTTSYLVESGFDGNLHEWWFDGGRLTASE